MPKWKVVGKFIYYASTVDTDMGPDAQGNPRIVRQMGPMERVEVGTILEDVPAHILATFPGRFQLVPETAPAPAEPVRAQTQSHVTPSDAPDAAAEPEREAHGSGSSRPRPRSS